MIAILILLQDPEALLRTVLAADIRRHQEVLAADAMEGREAGSEGGHRAALYIVAQVRRLGLRPGAPSGRFLQPFGKEQPVGPVEEANVVAVGKAVFKVTPHPGSAWTDLELPKERVALVDSADAVMGAVEKGARAVLVRGAVEGKASFAVPVAGVTKEVADAVAAAEGPVRISLSPVGLPGVGRKNVVAVWPGSDEKLRAEYVVVGAHYDHVGLGKNGSNGGKVGEIHNGADDNASGASTLLDIAEAVAQGSFPRTLVLVWFDNEENGLLGSRHFAANPTYPIGSCAAMLNMDMIGRNGTKEIFCGLQKDKEGRAIVPKWEAEVREVEKKYGLTFDWTKFDPFIRRSDHWPFMEKGVPAMFFTGGLHADYHKETDDVEKINFEKEELVGRIVLTLAARAASSPAGYRE